MGREVQTVFTYQITLISDEIDEGALRKAIEAAIGVNDISIRRSTDIAPALSSAAPIRTSKTVAAVLDMLRQRPWLKASDLVEALKPRAAGTVRKTIFDMHRAGQIIKVAHGVYTINPNLTEQQTNDAKAANLVSANSGGKYITAIEEGPKTAVELKDRFGVSRQRVEQILSKLMRAGTVLREETVNEIGHYVYYLPSQRPTVKTRDIRLRPAKARLISLLLPDRIYLTTDLAKSIGTQTTLARASLDALVQSGMVVTFKINSRHFVYLTAAGLHHPDYDANAQKCLPVNFIDLIGAERARFIESLAVLGNAQTFELTCCVGLDVFTHKSYASGQLIQRTRSDDIIQIKTKLNKKHASYELTRLGQYVSAIIARYRTAPSQGELLSLIAKGKRERADKIALANGAHASADGIVDALAPTYLGILRVLATRGASSTPSIAEAMEPRYENPRSANLAMRTLLDRGLVARGGRDPRNRAAVWSITDAGRARLVGEDAWDEDNSALAS